MPEPGVACIRIHPPAIHQIGEELMDELRLQKTDVDQQNNWSSTPLSIAYRPIDELKPDPKNPRQHDVKQVRQIANSIRQFGFVCPILVNAGGNIIAGHGRIQAARQLGMTTVPVVRVDHLTPAQVKALQIADNRLCEKSTWDERLLGEAFEELSLLKLNFDLDITGFELPEIDLMIASLGEPDVDEDKANDVPKPAETAVSKVGDLWRLDRHRLFCGSALDQPAYETVLDGALAEYVITDPPYNVPIQGHVSGNGAVQHREFAMASGEMSEAEFTDFLTKVSRLLVRFSTPGSVHCQFMDWRHMGELLQAGKAAYSELLNVCVWDKGRGGLGSLYRSQHELAFVFKNGKDPHTNNVQLGKYGRNRTNLWSCPAISTFGRSGEEGNLLALHPTVKPVRMLADAILDCSDLGGVVLDPFLGSGSTLIACERTGRQGRGIEIDPIYVDTAIRRWQDYTGEDAVNVASGRTFADHEAEVAHV